MSLTKVTYSMIDSSILNVRDFGAVGDGVADDTLALTAAAAALQDGQTLDFDGGTYLISYQGSPYSSVFGNIVMDFLDMRNISLIGNGATIKIVDHNISTYGGLWFVNFKGCKNVHISGFNFDMTFTGFNNSASYYPYVGAITGIDESSATPDFETLNSNFLIENCTFKLFHPFGAFVTTTNPYAGDPNNGYKMYTIFMQGSNASQQFANQNRDITIQNCLWKEGGNSYGIWTWAWNDVKVIGNTAESFVTKSSDTAGVYLGNTLPMVRNIPFYCEGLFVDNNYFRAKPTPERINGFEGAAKFLVHANNLGATNIARGLSSITNNTVILGACYLNQRDMFFESDAFGQYIIQGNKIDGIHGQTLGSVEPYGIRWNVDNVGNGVAQLTIDANIFGPWFLGNAIRFENGTNVSAAQRRCKELVITNNVQLSGDSFLRMWGTASRTYQGCESTIIANNIVDGSISGLYPPPSADNYGMFLAATEATDVVKVYGNIIRDKTRDIISSTLSCDAAAQIEIYDNKLIGITTPQDANNLFPYQINSNNVVLEATGQDLYEPFVICSNSSSGAYVRFYQQISLSYLQAENQLQIFTDNAVQVVVDSNVFRPGVDNTKNLGNASFRWANVYAGNGTIITVSDGREKQQIRELSDAERAVAVKIKSLIRAFKFNDAVEKKGDGARIHFGVIAQQVKEAFESEGLNAHDYAIFCYDEWEDQYEHEVINGVPSGPLVKVKEAGNRYGVRYEELLAFVISAL